MASTVLALGLGMALSLIANWAGQAVWEKLPGSEDLLFNELMVWGYVQRLRKQRRLTNTADLIQDESEEARRQRRLLERLVSGMETRDPYLHGHSRRVARHSWAIAQRMKLPREEIARVRRAAALHDVGKTKTPKSILRKADRLTDEEYRIIQLHPGEGAEMAAGLRDPELVAMIRHHHERLDGTGYPDGLAGETIPLGARIIAVADTFDAITSARPYRAASAHKKAIDILREEAGTRLDPEVVKAFCGNYAGRGPLALWSFLASLPERSFEWLGSSVGAAASAAKVVAVAAVVGGAAATSSTIGLASSAVSSAGRSHGSVSASRADKTARASKAAAVALGDRVTSHGTPTHAISKVSHRLRRRAGAVHITSSTAVSGAPEAAVTAVNVGRTGSPGSVTSNSTGNERSSSREEGAAAGKEESAGGKSEETKSVKEERSSTKKEEKAAAKSEEKAVKKEEEAVARSEERAVKKEEKAVVKSEERTAKHEEKGKGSESPDHGKNEGTGPESGSGAKGGESGEGRGGSPGRGGESGEGRGGESPGRGSSGESSGREASGKGPSIESPGSGSSGSFGKGKGKG